MAGSDRATLQTHIDYLRDLAERLEGTDREAVLAAVGLLTEFGDYLKKTGALR